MGRISHVESDCTNNSINSGRHNIQHNDTKRCNTRQNVVLSVAILITFVVLLTAVMLSIDILSIVVLTAVMLTAVMLDVVVPSVVALNSPLHTAARLPCNLICTLYHRSFYDCSKLEGL
jgi:hypothetical protein